MLYPIGVSSELAMLWLALPTIRDSKMWCLLMPNALNFAFDYYIFCLLGAAAYIPGLPNLYFYMLKGVSAPPAAARGPSPEHPQGTCRRAESARASTCPAPPFAPLPLQRKRALAAGTKPKTS